MLSFERYPLFRQLVYHTEQKTIEYTKSEDARKLVRTDIFPPRRGGTAPVGPAFNAILKSKRVVVLAEDCSS